MAFKNWRDVQVTVSDGDSPVNSIVLVFDSDATINIPGVVVFMLKDRGALPVIPELVDGEEQPMDGGFTIKPEDLVSVSEIAAQIALQGLPVGWVSTTDNSDTLDIDITDGEDNMLLPDSVIRGNWTDGGEGGESQEIPFTYTTPHTYPTLS